MQKLRKLTPIPLIKGIRSWGISDLFASGEQGAWYDPSGLSTLFQDSAGTVPVTAVEQPVGLILDKSGRGNHATQATTTKRPVYSRRVNQMPSSSGVGVAPWQIIAGNSYSTSGTGVLPVVTAGASTLDGEPVNRVILSLAGGTTSNDRSGMFLGTSVVGPFSVCIKSLNATPSATVAEGIVFNTGGTKSIVSLSDGWVRIDGMTSLGTTVRVQLWGTRGLDYADFLIGKASLTLATDTHLPYQRVNTATDYDADPAKFPAYLRFDGVDDAMVTVGNVDLSGTDKVTVWAGANVNNLGDAGGHMVVMLKDTGVNTFSMLAPATLANAIAFGATGNSASASSVETGLTASNFSAVLTGIADLAGNPASVLRRNSQQVASSSVATGGGMFANAPLYVGAQNTIRVFNGRLYSLIVRGAQTSLSPIEATERYVKQKMRMP